MSVAKEQKQFTKCLAELILWAYTELKVELTLGDGYRDPRLHGEFGTKLGYGASKSVHKLRLAMDLNLFVDGKYITDSSHPMYIKLGEYWETCHPLARWGGRFKDANHFSFEMWGCK